MAQFSKIAQGTSLIAAALLVAGATGQASAANDPTAAAKTEVVGKPAVQKLNRRALNAVYCVTTPVTDGARAKKECKSRGAWIKEGRDPITK